jgi:hypothetical protein
MRVSVQHQREAIFSDKTQELRLQFVNRHRVHANAENIDPEAFQSLLHRAASIS